jgi:hypothetical protein
MSAPSLTTDHFTAQYLYSNPTVIYPNSQRDASIDHVSGGEYWTLNRTGGTSNVNVTLSWDTNSGIVNDLSALRVARWDASLGRWKDHGNGGTTGNTTAGTIITSAAVTSFSPFALSSSTGANPLPVVLLSFTAVKDGENNVQLKWSTASEINSDYFQIERSKDGKYFQSIGRVKAAGNTANRVDYTYIDNAPFAGSSYYKLKQVDFDGTSTYSKVRFVESVDNVLTVYPNPTSDFLRIESNGAGIAAIKIRSEMGYILKVPFTETDGNFILNTASLAAGIYILEIQQEARTTVHKVVIEK